MVMAMEILMGMATRTNTWTILADMKSVRIRCGQLVIGKAVLSLSASVDL
jgi:hypothetical protein